jgi:hypothetical protein
MKLFRSMRFEVAAVAIAPICPFIPKKKSSR